MDDLLVGAPFASSPEVDRSGVVYAFYGQKEAMSTPVYSLKEKLADVTFYGQVEGERFGSKIAGGDLIGNGLTDFAVSAYASGEEQEGRVYIYRGLDRFLRSVRKPTNVIEGLSSKGWFGFDLDVGDINGDGVDDLAVGSFPYKGARYEAHASVFFGGARFNHKGAVIKNEKGSYNIVVKDPIQEALPGGRVMMEDMNGDGKEDLILGAPGIGSPLSSQAGDVYVLYSHNGELRESYSIEHEEISSVIHGEKADDWFGFAIEALDFNADGKADLAVGSRYADRGNGINSGKVHILLGQDRPHGISKTLNDSEDRVVTRGEFIKKVIEDFDIREKKSDFIESCNQFREFCFFNFSTVSTFDGMQLEGDLQLYPDVNPGDEFYEEINVATMLGLTNGFTGIKNTPFRPDEKISRMQALKVILAANELVKPMHKFELGDNVEGQPSYFEDISAKIDHMWWYPRYINFAVNEGIVKDGKYFRPDVGIALGELEMLIKGTLLTLERNAKIQS